MYNIIIQKLTGKQNQPHYTYVRSCQQVIKKKKSIFWCDGEIMQITGTRKQTNHNALNFSRTFSLKKIYFFKRYC